MTGAGRGLDGGSFLVVSGDHGQTGLLPLLLRKQKKEHGDHRYIVNLGVAELDRSLI